MTRATVRKTMIAFKQSESANHEDDGSQRCRVWSGFRDCSGANEFRTCTDECEENKSVEQRVIEDVMDFGIAPVPGKQDLFLLQNSIDSS
jgi:hypothetical protein